VQNIGLSLQPCDNFLYYDSCQVAEKIHRAATNKQMNCNTGDAPMCHERGLEEMAINHVHMYLSSLGQEIIWFFSGYIRI
jgi:hypothetical protein